MAHEVGEGPFVRVYARDGEQGLDYAGDWFKVKSGCLIIISDGVPVHVFAPGQWVEAEVFDE